MIERPVAASVQRFASTPETQWVGNARYFYWFTPFVILTIAALARKVAGTVALAGFVLVTTAWGFSRLEAYDYRIGVSPPLDNVIRVPCQIVRQARQTIYRVLAWNPFLSGFFRLCNVLHC